jgi:hypothetical protein
MRSHDRSTVLRVRPRRTGASICRAKKAFARGAAVRGNLDTVRDGSVQWIGARGSRPRVVTGMNGYRRACYATQEWERSYG